MKFTPPVIYPNFEEKLDNQKSALENGSITIEQYNAACTSIKKEALLVSKWHVEFRYENPYSFQKERFKVYEDINRKKGIDKIDYARLLKDSVRAALQSGYDPFAEREKRRQEAEKKIRNDRSEYTILRALNYFLNKKMASGKKKSTIGRYKTGINFFKDWLNKKEMLLVRACDITPDLVLEYLDEYRKIEKWGNKTYNNHLGTLQTAFNMMAMKLNGIIPENPIQGAETKSTISKKHTAYTDEQLSQLLTQVRKCKDDFMEGVIFTVYYACIRSKDELRHFQRKHILFDRDLIRLDGENTKGSEDQFIPLDDELKTFFLKKGYDKVPPDWYMFSNEGEPGPQIAFPNKYSLLFLPYRNFIGLDSRYTIYGFKHTRNVHLAQAGIDPYALMQLNRHSSLSQTMKYLRDLGVSINRKATENSRKL